MDNVLLSSEEIKKIADKVTPLENAAAQQQLDFLDRRTRSVMTPFNVGATESFGVNNEQQLDKDRT
jgi:hypothetical protein